LVATRLLHPEKALAMQRRVFEVGRPGYHELYQDREGSSPTNDNHWFREWSRQATWHLMLGVAALFVIVFWIGLSSVDRRLPGGGSSEERLKRTCLSTSFWLICGVSVIVLSVA